MISTILPPFVLTWGICRPTRGGERHCDKRKKACTEFSKKYFAKF